jgi:hypothetical protein
MPAALSQGDLPMPFQFTPTRLKTLLAAASLMLSSPLWAADCARSWAEPSSQNMNINSTFYVEITNYQNGERHFSVGNGKDKNAVDIYTLQGMLLAKGYSEAQIQQMGGQNLTMMPMTFMPVIAVLAGSLPDGPCHLPASKDVADTLDGNWGIKNAKFTAVQGKLQSSSPDTIHYELDFTYTPADAAGSTIHYAGDMTYSTRQEMPASSTDLAGYLLIMAAPPYTVIGSKDAPATQLGELRVWRASRGE